MFHEIHDLSLNVFDESGAVNGWVEIFYKRCMFPKDVLNFNSCLFLLLNLLSVITAFLCKEFL